MRYRYNQITTTSAVFTRGLFGDDNSYGIGKNCTIKSLSIVYSNKESYDKIKYNMAQGREEKLYKRVDR